MNEQRAQQLVVGCLAASTAVAAGSSLADGDTPGVSMLVGVAFTGVGLAALAMFNPDLAGGFAVLVLTTTTFVYGGPFFEAVTDLTKTEKAKSRKKSKSRKEESA